MIPLNQILFNLCFLTFGDDVLMLKRNKSPNQGLWNGVGGHIEPGESPLESCKREVLEETGYQLEKLDFAGILTWTGFEIPSGGLMIFKAEVNEKRRPVCCEGQLAWKPRSWVFSSPEVVSNIHQFGPKVLNGAPAQVYHFDYRCGLIQRHFVEPLPPGFDPANLL